MGRGQRVWWRNQRTGLAWGPGCSGWLVRGAGGVGVGAEAGAAGTVLEAGTTSGGDGAGGGGVEKKVRCGEGDGGAGRVMLVPDPPLSADDAGKEAGVLGARERSGEDGEVSAGAVGFEGSRWRYPAGTGPWETHVGIVSCGTLPQCLDGGAAASHACSWGAQGSGDAAVSRVFTSRPQAVGVQVSRCLWSLCGVGVE